MPTFKTPHPWHYPIRIGIFLGVLIIAYILFPLNGLISFVYYSEVAKEANTYAEKNSLTASEPIFLGATEACGQWANYTVELTYVNNCEIYKKYYCFNRFGKNTITNPTNTNLRASNCINN